MRIFVDANTLFSAAKPDGAIRHLMLRLVEPQHEYCADDYVVFGRRQHLSTGT